MRIPLLAGRLLNNGDRDDAEGAVVVNRSFVEVYLHGRDPVGVQIAPGDPDDPETEWLTIVGMVGDVRFRSLTADAEPELYIPTAQLPARWGHFVVRSGLPKDRLVGMVSDAVMRVDSDLPLADVKTGEEIIGGQLRASRMTTLLTTLFASSAMILAVIGILGVLSMLVAQRMREIGLRIALGAGVRSIQGFVVLKGMRPVLFGLTAGVLLSVVGLRVMGSFLAGPSAPSLMTVLVPTLGLTVAGLIACLIPAVRAASADPVTLMRSR